MASLMLLNSLMAAAYRGHARVFLKDLEAIRPSAIIDIIHSGETFLVDGVVAKGMKALGAHDPRLSELLLIS